MLLDYFAQHVPKSVRSRPGVPTGYVQVSLELLGADEKSRDSE